PLPVAFAGRDAAPLRVRWRGGEAEDPPLPRERSSSIRREAAALLRLGSKASPASSERRLRNEACDSVIGSPALFHSSGGRSSGFGIRDLRAAPVPVPRRRGR